MSGVAFWKDHLVIAHVGDPKPVKVVKTEDELRSFSYDVVSGLQNQGAKEVGTEACSHPIPELPQTIEDIRFYVDSMTRVDGGEHTQDPDGEWDRVDGRQVCDQCGKTYQNHPLDGPEGYDGKFLNRICDGRLVKL